MALVAVFISLLFFYSLISRRLEKTVLTAPIVFTAAGMLAMIAVPGLRDWNLINREVFLVVAEIGLVLLLFTDASRTDLKILKSLGNLPVRLLSTGMLLTILLGMLAGAGIFHQLSFWEAGILAAILAPTDAGLGQVIVNSPLVPMRIRQALNVEAGLNDGLSVPFMLFFIALAGTIENRDAHLAQFIGEQLGYGVLAGGGIGFIGGWLLGIARRKGWMADSLQQLGVVVLPLLCALVSEEVGASMFIAAFVAGLAVQFCFKEAGRHSVEFTEEWGQLLNLFVFFIFGLLVARSWHQFTWPCLIYAVLSLTLVRILPVAIALRGTGLCRATVLFMGWFGPRGLASIVLGLVYLQQETQQLGESTIRLAVMMTVGLSIFAHGLSAMPGIKLYAKQIAALPSNAPEHKAA